MTNEDRRIRIETEKAPASKGYRSNAMAAAGYVFTAGHIGAPLSAPDEDVAPEGSVLGETDLCLQHMAVLAEAGGGDRDRFVEVSAFLVPQAYREREQVVERIEGFLGYRPALLNVVEVADVALHGLMEIDGIALGDPDLSLTEAATALSGFGHAEGIVRCGPFVALNQVQAPGASLGEQSEAVLAEADARLRAVGSGLDQTVKMTVYMGGYDIYPEFNEATKRAFAAFTPPARSVLVAPRITGEFLLRIDFLALAGE